MRDDLMHSLEDAIKLLRVVPNFPKQGVDFIDISALLKDKDAFSLCMDELADRMPDVDYVAGIEARGFIIGGVLAKSLGTGFIPIRKKGKLPLKAVSERYDSEYGSETLEIHQDAITKGSRVLVVDDVLATGGTSRAAAKLVKRLGGNVVALAYLVEIQSLKGREALSGYNITSLIGYNDNKLSPL